LCDPAKIDATIKREGMDDISIGRFLGRVTCCHVVTYFMAGVLAYSLLDYQTQFQTEYLACLMLPTSSKWVALGPALQVIRSFLFALVLYPFRKIFLVEDRGWLKLWGLFLGLAILGTAGPAPASLEGLFYTKIPAGRQAMFLPETVLQTLAFSILLVAWHRKPSRAWGRVMMPLALLVILMSIAGALAPRPNAFQ